jgi:ParB family chromosome partitioning protein
LRDIPAVVKDATDNDSVVWALVENLQRQDLSPIETADALHDLEERLRLTHEELGKRIGCSRAQVTNLLRLRALEPELQAAIDDGRLTAGHGRALLAIADGAVRVRLAEEITAKGLSVRAAEARAGALAKPKPERAASAEHKGTAHDGAWRAVRERLERMLSTRVEVRVHDSGNGTLTVHFQNHKDLNRILDAIERPW